VQPSILSQIPSPKFEPVKIQTQPNDAFSQKISILDIIHKKVPITTKVVNPIDKSEQNIPSQINHANFQINIEKHKEATFLLFETGNPDDYILKLVGHNGQLFQYGYALINDMKTSQYFQKLLGEVNIHEKKDGICVLCRYHPVFKKWKPIEAHIGEMPTNISDLQ
jgi:hypothetical protein